MTVPLIGKRKNPETTAGRGEGVTLSCFWVGRGGSGKISATTSWHCAPEGEDAGMAGIMVMVCRATCRSGLCSRQNIPRKRRPHWMGLTSLFLRCLYGECRLIRLAWSNYRFLPLGSRPSPLTPVLGLGDISGALFSSFLPDPPSSPPWLGAIEALRGSSSPPVNHCIPTLDPFKPELFLRQDHMWQIQIVKSPQLPIDAGQGSTQA